MMKLLSLLMLIGVLGSIGSGTITYNEVPKVKDSFIIHEGIVCTSAKKIKYKRKGHSIAKIRLSEPVIVAQADRDEPWGFFQFPTISKADDGTLIVTWQMQEDSHKAYGKKSGREYVPMMSKDGGITWTPQDKNYHTYHRGYNIHFGNGSNLQIVTPASKDIQTYHFFPEPVVNYGKTSYYKMNRLPDELQGVYLTYQEKGKSPVDIHAKLDDPGLLRYAIDNLMPIVWWGNIKQLANNTLVAGVYPSSYQDNHGNITHGGVSFYSSTNNGLSWDIRGKIPFRLEALGDKAGFTEPTFEILADSTFTCVMRTGSSTPMFQSFSLDFGRSWSSPEPITPNGVMPQLLLLKNGVLVLVSGRPGVQLRFSFDGTGRTWSDPIDMIPFMNADGSYNSQVSCGYASILENEDNSFYLVYSDFTTKDSLGIRRKSIICREIKVKS